MSDEIIEPNKAPVTQETRQQIADMWREVNQGPAGGGLLGRLSLKARVSNTRVLNNLVAEQTQLHHGFASLHSAKLEHGRALETLRDAQTIFKADADKRAAEKADAEIKRNLIVQLTHLAFSQRFRCLHRYRRQPRPRRSTRAMPRPATARAVTQPREAAVANASDGQSGSAKRL
jgi:hypothetical protein